VRSLPHKVTHSVTATDGSLGWKTSCQNGHDKAHGGTGENSMSPSDRQVTLANIVQAEFRKEAALDPLGPFVGKHVSMLAYGDTSVKPTIRLDPEVYVTVTTAFIQGGRTTIDVANDYRAMSSPNQVIGFYSYIGTQLWGHGMPTSSKMTNQTTWPGLFNETMQVTADSPIRNIKGESGMAWGAYGLGFYTFSRLYTPPSKPKSDPNVLIPQIKADFLAKAFGPAAVPAGQWFDLVTAGDGRIRILSTDLLHRMYDYLSQARALINPAVDVEIKARIDDLILYTRAVELWRLTLVARNDNLDRFNAYNTLSQYIFRIKPTLMFDFYNFFYDPIFREFEQQMIDLHPFDKYTPSAITNKSGWNAAPFTEEEIQTILSQGLALNPLFPFIEVTYSFEDLETTTAFDCDIRGREGGDDAFIDTSKHHDWYLKTKPDQFTFTLSAKAGSGPTHVPNPKGPATIELYQTDLASGIESFVGSMSLIADNLTVVTRTFVVAPATTYRIRVIDPHVIVHLNWDKTLNRVVNIPSEGEYHLRYNTSYFYVPTTATQIGAWLGRDGSKITAPDGTVIDTQNPKGEYVSVLIDNPANKGQVWKIYCSATDNPLQGCYLYTVPPQLARTPQELLIQKSVILQDGLEACGRALEGVAGD
jgi:hypothetical protein